MWSPFASEPSIRRLIRAARSTPAVYTVPQCSYWIRADDRIELRAMDLAGPLRREVTISCGAALFNLRLAIRVAGHNLTEWLLPDPQADPLLLASVEIATGRIRRPAVTTQELYDAIPVQRTLPEPYNGPPVPDNILAAMKVASFYQQGWLRVLNRAQVRRWLADTESAEQELAGNEVLRKRRARGSGGFDGPGGAFGWPARNDSPPGTDPPLPADSKRAARSAVNRQMMSLSTRGDRPLDWLRAGRALQCALLTAARYGVAASFAAQPLELTDLKADSALEWPERKWPWRWVFTEVPQMVLQVGTVDGNRPSEPALGLFPEVWDARKDPPQRLKAA